MILALRKKALGNVFIPEIYRKLGVRAIESLILNGRYGNRGELPGQGNPFLNKADDFAGADRQSEFGQDLKMTDGVFSLRFQDWPGHDGSGSCPNIVHYAI